MQGMADAYVRTIAYYNMDKDVLGVKLRFRIYIN